MVLHWRQLVVLMCLWGFSAWGYDSATPPLFSECEDHSLVGRSQFLDDWNGLRTEAKDKGITLYATYGNDLQTNVHGGLRPGFANASVFYLRAVADLETLMHTWCGLSLTLSMTYRSGQNLSADAIGNEFPVAQLAGGSTYFFDEFYLKQQLKRDTFFKFGRLVADYDFATNDLLDLYVTFAIDGSPINIFYNSPFPTDPFASWGAYFQVSPIRDWVFKFGIYNGNLRSWDNRYHGLNWTFAHPNGIMMISQADYHLPGHLPGNYRIGAYYTAGKTPIFRGGSAEGNWGWYFLVDQVIWQHGTTSLTPWAMGLFAPQEDRNPIPDFFSAGMSVKGLFKNHPSDTLNLGYAIGWFSSELRSAQRAGVMNPLVNLYGAFPKSWEDVWELNYWLHITPWFIVVPVIQWVGNPGATHTIPDALVLGVQVGIVL